MKCLLIDLPEELEHVNNDWRTGTISLKHNSQLPFLKLLDRFPASRRRGAGCCRNQYAIRLPVQAALKTKNMRRVLLFNCANNCTGKSYFCEE